MPITELREIIRRKNVQGWMLRTEKWKQFLLKTASRHSEMPTSTHHLWFLNLLEAPLPGSSPLIPRSLPRPPGPLTGQGFHQVGPMTGATSILPSLPSGLPVLFIFNAFDSFPSCSDQVTSTHLLPPGGVNSSCCSICLPQTHPRADLAMPASQVSISKYYAAVLGIKDS